MAKTVEVTCPECGHVHYVDLTPPSSRELPVSQPLPGAQPPLRSVQSHDLPVSKPLPEDDTPH